MFGGFDIAGCTELGDINLLAAHRHNDRSVIRAHAEFDRNAQGFAEVVYQGFVAGCGVFGAFYRNHAKLEFGGPAGLVH